MKKLLDWKDRAVVETFNEVTLWSAPLGRLLLENMPMRKGMTVLDIGFGMGFPCKSFDLLQLPPKKLEPEKCISKKEKKELICRTFTHNAPIVSGVRKNITMKFITILLLGCFAITALGQTTTEYKKEIKAHRKHYKADFLKDERSPFFGKKKALKKMRFFKADQNYKVLCNFRRTEDAQPFDMATYSGKVKSFVKYGIITFEINDQKQELSVYRNLGLMRMEAYANHLFLPFKDQTNDITTYGGGRYIDLEVGDIVDGKVLIDFNKCYNPWCAFSAGYNCPVPPKENHLAMELKAGEKKYVGKKMK